jgi:hypothetical protein
MSVVDSLARQASRFANDVQVSLKRARVEGERRLLQRQHRAALEELGMRAYELVRAGDLPEGPLASEIASVERKLIELDTKEREIAEMQAEDAAQGTPPPQTDAVDTAFPMMGTTPPDGPGTQPPTSAGPGWEAADRFFRSDR